MLISSSAFADKALGPEEFTSVDELAYAIAAYFPKVQGGVTAVQGDRLTLALGEKTRTHARHGVDALEGRQGDPPSRDQGRHRPRRG